MARFFLTAKAVLFAAVALSTISASSAVGRTERTQVASHCRLYFGCVPHFPVHD
jgi:hypothetical protein